MTVFIRNALVRLYLFSGGCAAFSLFSLLFLVIVQMSSRWFELDFPGLSNYAGYCLGSASFFGLGYALNHGSHIRVTLIVSHSGGFKKFIEVAAVGVSMVIAGWFAVHAVINNINSFELGELSQGQDVTPIWIPQLTMSLGAIVFFISLLDLFLCLLLSRTIFSTALTTDNKEF